MNDLCGEYPVTLNGRSVGTLTVVRNGLFTEFSCHCRCSPEEVPRLICVSGENSVCVGVPIYNSGELSLNKKYSKNALINAGFADTITDCFLSYGIIREKSAEKVPEVKTPVAPLAKPEPKSSVIQFSPEKQTTSPNMIVTAKVPPEPVTSPSPIATAKTSPEIVPVPNLMGNVKNPPDITPNPTVMNLAKASPDMAPNPIAVNPAKTSPDTAPNPIAVNPAKTSPDTAPNPTAMNPAKTSPDMAPNPTAMNPAKTSPDVAINPTAMNPAKTSPEVAPKPTAMNPAKASPDMAPNPTAMGSAKASPNMAPNPTAMGSAKTSPDVAPNPTAMGSAKTSPDVAPKPTAMGSAKASPDMAPARVNTPLPAPVSVLKSQVESTTWGVEHEPSRLFYAPELSAACRSVTGALTRREGEMTLLAVPVSSDEPFPMLPVFCFGEPWIIGSRDYIVFRIKNGELTAG